jgi:hypothetical protein
MIHTAILENQEELYAVMCKQRHLKKKIKKKWGIMTVKIKCSVQMNVFF